jgi:quinol monooxygenase YgiN
MTPGRGHLGYQAALRMTPERGYAAVFIYENWQSQEAHAKQFEKPYIINLAKKTEALLLMRLVWIPRNLLRFLLSAPLRLPLL